MESYNLHTLAVVANSLSKLQIKNMTVFSIIKAHLLRLSHPDNINSQIQELEPLSISSFLGAFSKIGIFDFDLYEALQNSFIK